MGYLEMTTTFMGSTKNVTVEGWIAEDFGGIIVLGRIRNKNSLQF